MSPGGVKKMMSLDALSGELDGDIDDRLDSEMPSAEAGGETVLPDTNGEVASALGVLTGAAKVVGEAKSEVGLPLAAHPQSIASQQACMSVQWAPRD